jgi:succinyl-diaminopimelate desuccinylase
MTVEDILNNLVAFKTVDGNAEEFKACFDYIEEFLSNRQLVVKRHNSQGYESIVATTAATQKPKVMLQAHVDVVPAREGSFKLQEVDGKLRGRGTYDMKFAAACFLMLADELRSAIQDYDFGLMLTSDEEIGGHNGVEMLLKNGYGAEVCVLPDGGDNWAIESVCNGLWIIYLKAAGKSAHGSRPWEGENAIDKLLVGVNQIKELFKETGAGKNSLTLSEVEGGCAVNQVPDSARATLDMRFVSDEEYHDKRAQIEQIAQANGLEIETCAEVATCVTNLKEPHVAKFVETVEAIRGEPIKETRSLGASDARHFTATGIPVILIRPDGGGPHSDHEWIDKAGLGQFYEVIKTYVREVAKKT